MIEARLAPPPPLPSTAVSGTAAILSSPLASSRMGTSAFLSWPERQALQNALSPPFRVEANTDLVREGARADELFIILDGWACRYSTTDDGGRQLPAVLLPGDVGNLDSLMFDRLDYGVRTLSEATVAALPRDRALALAQQHPGIARTFTWLALIENTILTKWMQMLGRRSARAGLAHLLCELGARLGGPDSGKGQFRCPMTQEQLADVLGLTSVHLNRVLQQLRADRLIATRCRMVIMPDVARLRRSCGFDPRYLHLDGPGGRLGPVETVLA